MAQIELALYNTIAQSYANIWTYINSTDTEARVSVDAIVDVTTGTYTPNGGGGGDAADAALEIELAILDVFNAAYVASGGASTTTYLDPVRAINNHVINNYSGLETTADAKLAEFVVTTMLGTWTDSCIPLGWEQLSEDAGYDTDDWADSVCS